MRLAVDLSLTSVLRSGAQGWRPAQLFRNGAQGVWYAPGQAGTLFLDAAGTQPVTMPGQPVALMRDISGKRRHAIQATLAARPTFAREPAGGRRNMLPANSANIAQGANWSSLRVERAAAVESATGEPAAIITATVTDVNGAAAYPVNIPLAAGQYTMSAVVKGAGWIVLRPTVSSDFADAALSWFNLGTGAAGTSQIGGGASVFTATSSAITAQGDGYLVRITFTLGTAATISLRFYAVDGNNALSVTTGAAFRMEAPQLETGAVRTAYQRRVSAFDVTEAGQRSLHCLAFDGVDDFMAMASAFAPAGAYTMTATRDASGFPGGLTFESATPGASLVQSVSTGLTANTSANSISFAPSGWPSGLAGARRLDLVRVAGATSAQAWRNGVLAENGITLAGNLIPMSAISRLGRAGTSGRFYGGVMIDRAITEVESQFLRRDLAYRGGIAL